MKLTFKGDLVFFTYLHEKYVHEISNASIFARNLSAFNVPLPLNVVRDN